MWHFGIGSIISGKNIAIMPLITDSWIYDQNYINKNLCKDKFITLVVENFLTREKIIKLDQKPSIVILQDDKSEQLHEQEETFTLPTRVFPEYLECTNCHRIDKFHKFKLNLRFSDKLRYCNNDSCRKKGGSTLKPVRWIKVCAKGHTEDFPFIEFVHDFDFVCNIPNIKYELITGTSSGAAYKLSCENASCKAKEKFINNIANMTNVYPELKKCNQIYFEGAQHRG
jgi:hypothetical protein